ncbi:hypothetical protein F8M41_000567 [Gigaspora margarita]|uniref:Uncharacterized protein n=1 Tax=Gigaspora margarita TaxID=4874 RepID=A0A8H4A8I2_GIGMA|nr:hypothetical protein F8M41_000567 [Gigaspora margarita]
MKVSAIDKTTGRSNKIYIDGNGDDREPILPDGWSLDQLLPVYQPPGDQPSGYPPSGYPPSGDQSSGCPPSGYPQSEYQPSGNPQPNRAPNFTSKDNNSTQSQNFQETSQVVIQHLVIN